MVSIIYPEIQNIVLENENINNNLNKNKLEIITDNVLINNIQELDYELELIEKKKEFHNYFKILLILIFINLIDIIRHI